MKKMILIFILVLCGMAYSLMMPTITGVWNVVEIDPRTGQTVGTYQYEFVQPDPLNGYYGDIYQGSTKVGYCHIIQCDPPQYYDLYCYFFTGKHYRCHVFSDSLILGIGVNPLKMPDGKTWLQDIWIDIRR